MRFRQFQAWTVLVLAGLFAEAARADVRSIIIDQTPPSQEAGPFIIPIGKGFHVELTLDVLNTSEIVVGDRTLKFSGKGGAVSGNGTVYLEGGKTYPIREKYAYTARIASIFINGEFSVSAETSWEYRAAQSGNYTFSFTGSARDLVVTLGGDVVGELREAIVGNTIVLGLTTIRTIPRNAMMVYSANFKATLQRTATVTFKDKSLPPWDLDRTGTIDITDIVIVGLNFGNIGVGLQGDVNLDGTVNIVDLVLVARHFGEQNAFAAPQAAFGGESARIRTAGVRQPNGKYRFDVDAQTPSPVGGYAVNVSYDPAQWRLTDAANRLPSATALPMPSAEGVARLIAVTLPMSDSRTVDGTMASFTFEPLTPSANPAEIRIRELQLSDNAGKRLRTEVMSARFPTAQTSAMRLQVGQNFPNPFNPETWIPFTLALESPVTVDIFTADGRLVRRLDLGKLPAGTYAERDKAAYWDGRNAAGERVASGVYFYRVTTSTESQSRRMVIVK